MMYFIEKKIKNKKGQSIFELSFIFPVMCIMFLWMFDCARVINAKWDVMTITREAVRTMAFQKPAVATTEAKKVVLNLFAETSTPGMIKGNESAYVIGLQSGDKMSDPISAKICGNVQLILPALWINTENGNSMQVCGYYYMQRTYLGV